MAHPLATTLFISAVMAAGTARCPTGVWQFGGWGTQVFVTTAGNGTTTNTTAAATAVSVQVSPADANNTGRFFPGHFHTAAGTYEPEPEPEPATGPDRLGGHPRNGIDHQEAVGGGGGGRLRLQFDNGTEASGQVSPDCETVRWPSGLRWYRLPRFSWVKRVHVVQSCHLDIGFAGTSVAIINRYIGPDGYAGQRLDPALLMPK